MRVQAAGAAVPGAALHAGVGTGEAADGTEVTLGLGAGLGCCRTVIGRIWLKLLLLFQQVGERLAEPAATGRQCDMGCEHTKRPSTGTMIEARYNSLER